MFEEHMKKLEKNRKAFREIKEANKEDVREYLNKQENILSALFSMVINDVFCSDKEKEEEPVIETGESVSEVEESTVEQHIIPNVEDYSDNIKISDILKSELDSWGLKESYAGYNYLLAVEKVAHKYTGGITDDEYDAICADIGELFNKTSKDVKGSLTFIRKKAVFKDAKYLTVLSKMPRMQITNQFILNQFIELCF